MGGAGKASRGRSRGGYDRHLWVNPGGDSDDIRRVRTKFRVALPVLLLLILLSPSLEAQEPAPLPDGYGELRLGMAMADLKERLQASGSFMYRGDPDVSLLERENRTLLEAEGSGYIASGQFQFNAEDRLFVIVLVLDERLIDYFSLYTTFTGKYGDPADLNPSRAIWENDTVRVSLERPAVVRYIQKDLFQEGVDVSAARKSYERISREEFLSRF